MKDKVEIRHKFTGDVVVSCSSCKGNCGGMDEETKFPKLFISCIENNKDSLEGTDLMRAYFTIDHNLRDQDYIVLDRINLGGVNLKGACLEGLILTYANLEEANLDGADLNGAVLTGVNLYGASLKNANLDRTYLGRANLGEADLEGSTLYGTALCGAYLNNTNLKGIRKYADSWSLAFHIMKKNSGRFTTEQKEIGSRVFVFGLDWVDAKKEYGEKLKKIFEVISELGWGEYLEEWDKVVVMNKDIFQIMTEVCQGVEESKRAKKYWREYWKKERASKENG